MKKFLCSIFSVAFFAVLFLLGFSQNVSAAKYDISSFGLMGQKTYGAANAWQTNLGYSGTTFHSVYQWEVKTASIPSSDTGKYATIELTGIINGQSLFRFNLNQGISVVQCAVGGSIATLSNVQAYLIDGLDSDGYHSISYSISATAEFPTNNISGQALCTIRSNNGIYALQAPDDMILNVTFGTTNFNINFTNSLSDELLQQQINQNNTIINQNNTIIQGVGQTTDAVNNMSQNLQNKLDEQTEQQKNQYDQEKAEEQEREEQGNSDADQLSGIFDFSIVNPFYFLTSGFTPGNSCVSIPTLASMVGSNETQFCPFFSAETRNIVTPVLTLLTTVTLFGFFVSWLRGSAFDSSIDNSMPGQRRLF